jgi:peptidoglycan/xylan/chitin deacetylase (PgdA/CDA1 family)
VVTILALGAWLPPCTSTASYAGARNQVLASGRTLVSGPDLVPADVRRRSPRAARNVVTIGWLVSLLLLPVALVVGLDPLGLLIRLLVTLPILGLLDELFRYTDARPDVALSRVIALPAALLGMRPEDEHREVAIEAWRALHLEKTIALTFDDGPHPEFTLRIAEALEQRGVPATFFVVGERAEAHPEIVRSLAAAGHSVQNHSLTHVDLRDLDDAGFATEVDGASEVLERLVARPSCVRPPFGRHDDMVVERIEQRGLRMVLWDISVLDWKQQPARWIAGQIVKRAEPGSVVLLHDGGGDREQTVRAVPMLVDSLVDRGYRFVTID